MTARSGGEHGTVTVVVPVYGPSPDLGRCLDSVAAGTDLARHRVLVVADGPLLPEPARAVSRLVEERAAGTELVVRPVRGGFPAAANEGIRASAGDVVLLNSDTEVTKGWLDRLAEAARRVPRAASVTPFSNHATLCSLPRPFAENRLPAGQTVASFGRLVEARSRRLSPRIPTGVGFCLYLRREAIDEVGLFDEEGFGAGYGEEVDWCLRASARGFAHLLDDATFVWHRGGGSFGPEAAARARRAERLLARRFPRFLPELSRFMREDPLRAAREPVLAALRPPGRRRRRVAHLVHGWPPDATGGTEVFARTVALSQAVRWDVAVYARFSDPSRRKGAAVELLDGGARVRLVVNDFVQRDPVSRGALHDAGFARDFGRFLDEERPDLLHVHHLAGHAATLPLEARRRGIPVVFQLQDWWAPCARVNFLHSSGASCSGPSPLKCARCRPLTGLPPRGLTNPALHLLRAALMRRALAAERFVAGSRFLARSWQEAGWLPGTAAVEVVPYGVPALPVPVARPPAGRPLRFGFVGALMPHKGAHVAAGAFRGLPPDRARLRIWGDPTAAPGYARQLASEAGDADVRVEGPFPEGEKAAVFAGMDVLLVPSVGLESYGLVVDEAMAHGVPVVASRLGALPERYDESCGGFVPAGDPEALRSEVLRLAARPEQVDAWRRALPRVRTLADTARRIEEIYHEVLAAGGGP
ncbi:MAG: glycosyltransferase [Thermoanaerobaculia bacterium]